MTAILNNPRTPQPLTSSKLGEELPVFCERCGYSLHGLPQVRCEHCTILQFHCPECGHHQPINTLRPAAQTLLGRIRGGWLILVVFFKFNLFSWLLFAWGAMGGEFAYLRDWEAMNRAAVAVRRAAPTGGVIMGTTTIWIPASLTWETVLPFFLFGLPCGMVWRMALLRWRSAWVVGLVLAALTLGAMVLGVTLRGLDFPPGQIMPFPYNSNFVTLMTVGCGAVAVGAMLVWPLWVLLVNAFLPRNTAVMLLNWQRSLSNSASELTRGSDGEAVPGTRN